MNSGEQQKSSNIETWHQAAFLNSSMPMLLFDVSDVGKKCKELEGFEIIDIDRYLAAELFFKKYSASYIQMVAVNKAALSLFQVYEDRELSSGKSKIYSQLHAKISNEIVGNIFRKCVSSEYEFEVKENGILKYIGVIVDIFISDGNE